ncbi:MAG: patatin-like phospholipase family protein [Deltaproteobacteria bacterium]|nr:patatin-like phospholipase family protein [Deltaproteobacteria bacterium]
MASRNERSGVGNSGRGDVALVLSGGGARGAYQVGVLKGLAELGIGAPGKSPFSILVGSSAGSINAAMLAAHADRFEDGVAQLARLWGNIQAKQVFRTDVASLGGIGLKWVRDLTFGGALGHVAPKALLDTAPLRKLLAKAIPFGDIAGNVERGGLKAVAISATNLYTTNGVVFVQGARNLPTWSRIRRQVERTEIGVEHLMASSAIPVFFPSVEIGGRHFGDGCIRNTSPLEPAIQLGAQRIVAVGVRESSPRPESVGPTRLPPPTIAQIAGVLLDAVMLDSIEVDVDHALRVNQSVAAHGGAAGDPFHLVDVLWLSPTRSFGELAAEMADHVPGIVRYLLRGLGGDEATTELVSYLLFDAAFCSRLIELGADDVKRRAGEVRAFFASEGDAGSTDRRRSRAA